MQRYLLMGTAAAALLTTTAMAQSVPPAIAAPPSDVAAMEAGAASASKYSAEDEALYMQRFNKLLQDAAIGAGLDAYDTLEPVAGAANAAPLPHAADTTLSLSALVTAEAYAAQRNSSALVILRHGKIEHESYYGDYAQDTPLVSKSLAKPITALLIGRALVQGHIESLDQPVADFITEWKGDAGREKILIRHLLDMRTGLLPQGFSPDPQDILNRAYLHPRHDEVIINDYPLTHEPGDRYEYANSNSELIAPLIERATGMRYGDYMSEALLKPIGAMGGEIWVNRPGGTAHSGCCVLLPAQSYVRMAMLVMTDGVWEGERLLPEGYVAEMRTGTPGNPYYGLGLWLPHTFIDRRGFAHPDQPLGKVFHGEPYLDREIAMFDGNSNQIVYMIPSADMVVLRMGDRPAAQVEWDNAFLPNLLIRDAHRAPDVAMPEPQPR